ncbi:NUDIX hydrolase [Candidatus Saccharibacteria bacterium]|nr:NUDIX hydrolase [Candidatus Saccharibacteria bacterium]
MNNVNLRVAAKAVIAYKNKVLVVREGGKYEDGNNIGQYGLVGGRIEPDESFYDALDREILEETGLKVKTTKPLQVGEWWPEIKGVKNHIVAVFMICEAKTDRVVLSDEHDDFKWVNLNEIQKLPVMEPDRSVAIEFLSSLPKT